MLIHSLEYEYNNHKYPCAHQTSLYVFLLSLTQLLLFTIDIKDGLGSKGNQNKHVMNTL